MPSRTSYSSGYRTTTTDSNQSRAHPCTEQNFTLTRKYAEAYCRISSYLQSMANQGYNPLVAIQIALAGRAVDNMGE